MHNLFCFFSHCNNAALQTTGRLHCATSIVLISLVAKNYKLLLAAVMFSLAFSVVFRDHLSLNNSGPLFVAIFEATCGEHGTCTLFPMDWQSCRNVRTSKCRLQWSYRCRLLDSSHDTRSCFLQQSNHAPIFWGAIGANAAREKVHWVLCTQKNCDIVTNKMYVCMYVCTLNTALTCPLLCSSSKYWPESLLIDWYRPYPLFC